MNIFKLSLLNCAVSLALLSAGAQAATVDVSKLGTELTPFGAEKAGNADGSIPAWTGGLTKAPEGWAPGHGDPYAGDKPLFCAIRLFTTPDGWVAKFTGDEIARSFPEFVNPDTLAA